jgi:hypothetical protein
MAHPIKQRLLVMNGQRILQTQAHQGADWINQSVSKAGALKPGSGMTESLSTSTRTGFTSTSARTS